MSEFITQIDAGMGFTGEVQASTLAHPEEWFFDALTWGRSDSGETVNPITALSHGPVWQAVNIRSGDMAQIPVHVYKKTGDRKSVLQESHPVEWLLNHEPNPWQTPTVFTETLESWALLWGNGCAWIVRNGAGQPIALIPLMPDRTHPRWLEGEWWIETDFGNGERILLDYNDVFHRRGLATDGFWGLSVVEVAKNVIGGGLALRKHGNRTFKNSARPAGALTNPGQKPSPEVMAEHRRQIEAIHSGSENAGKWLMLYGGTTFSPMSMSNADAQWLEAMDLDREFVAGIFLLPPYKLGAMKNAAVRANVEQQKLEYYGSTLSLPLKKSKEEIHRKLFSYSERRLMRLYAEYDLSDILRGDMASTMSFLSVGVQMEILSQNEARDWLGYDALPGGDTPRNPSINPIEKQSPSEPKQPARREDHPPPDEAKQAVRAMVQGQVTALLLAESKAVEKAANPDIESNFLRWSEKYYGSYLDASAYFLDTPCRVARALGMGQCDWRAVCSEHARASLNRITAMAGICTKDSLPSVGKEIGKSIREQADMLASGILGD